MGRNATGSFRQLLVARASYRGVGSAASSGLGRSVRARASGPEAKPGAARRARRRGPATPAGDPRRVEGRAPSAAAHPLVGGPRPHPDLGLPPGHPGSSEDPEASEVSPGSPGSPGVSPCTPRTLWVRPVRGGAWLDEVTIARHMPLPPYPRGRMRVPIGALPYRLAREGVVGRRRGPAFHAAISRRWTRAGSSALPDAPRRLGVQAGARRRGGGPASIPSATPLARGGRRRTRRGRGRRIVAVAPRRSARSNRPCATGRSGRCGSPIVFSPGRHAHRARRRAAHQLPPAALVAAVLVGLCGGRPCSRLSEAAPRAIASTATARHADRLRRDR